MISRMNGLRLVYAYVGWPASMDVRAAALSRSRRTTLFYHWEPEAFLLRQDVQGVRVQFPDYYYGCEHGNTYNADTGTMGCDFAEDPLQNFAAARVRTVAPEAYYFLSHLKFTRDEMNGMLRRTMDDGGSLDAFEAACEIIQANRDTFLTYVPPCIRNHQEIVRNGDVVFNSEALRCDNATLLPSAPPTACASKMFVASADRVHVKITLVRRDWLSHELVTATAEIVLRDYLGYTVETLINDVTAPKEWGNDMIDLDLYDIDMESWQVDQETDAYADYILTQLVRIAGWT
eukprot:3712483-Amphidinium_carterae.1